MKFRKKPVVIDAIRFDSGDMNKIVRFLGYIPDANFNGTGEPQEILIQTLEGEMIAMRGDWIIKGIKGEFYPCKPDIFIATYDPAEERTREEGK